MKVSQKTLDNINRDRIEHDPEQAMLAHLWDVAWERRCFDPTCRADHAFRVVIAIGEQEDALPYARIALWEDQADAMVPMTKAAVAELITDLRACLDALP